MLLLVLSVKDRPQKKHAALSHAVFSGPLHSYTILHRTLAVNTALCHTVLYTVHGALQHMNGCIHVPNSRGEKYVENKGHPIINRCITLLSELSRRRNIWVTDGCLLTSLSAAASSSSSPLRAVKTTLLQLRQQLVTFRQREEG